MLPSINECVNKVLDFWTRKLHVVVSVNGVEDLMRVDLSFLKQVIHSDKGLLLIGKDPTFSGYECLIFWGEAISCQGFRDLH